MIYPPVSCYCSTYGRVKCLEELIYSFINQNYPGKKELVILNDFSEQELIYHHPEVVIINSNIRIKPLAKKFNDNINYCSYDILACLEDDDKYLPNHLTYAVENMKDGIFHSGVSFVYTGTANLHYAGNYFHSSHVFTRDLFNKVGQYTVSEVDNCALDVTLMSKFQKEVGNYTQTPPYENTNMLYGWNNGYWQGSGLGTVIKNMSDIIAGYVQTQKNNGTTPTGKIILNPFWKYPYEELRASAIKVLKEKSNAN